MKRSTLAILALVAGSLVTSCGDQGANTANKSANSTNTANTSTSTDNSAEIKKLMSDLGAALAKNDADAAAKFYSDDYHLITPQGVDQSKAERIADMKSGKSKFESFEYTNVNVKSYGDVAIATSNVVAKGVLSGATVSNAIATVVWRKDKDGWKAVMGQATPLATGATPTRSDQTKPAANANSKPAAGNANK